MTITRTFNTAGVSTLHGVVKARFANGMLGRIKVLKANLHTAIRLVELPTDMSSADAVKYLIQHADFQDQEAQEVLKAKLASKKEVAA